MDDRDVVRAACASTRERAHRLPEGSPERAAACGELRSLEQAAALTAVLTFPCGACAGSGRRELADGSDRMCFACYGVGTVEREVAA